MAFGACSCRSRGWLSFLVVEWSLRSSRVWLRVLTFCWLLRGVASAELGFLAEESSLRSWKCLLSESWPALASDSSRMGESARLSAVLVSFLGV